MFFEEFWRTRTKNFIKRAMGPGHIPTGDGGGDADEEARDRGAPARLRREMAPELREDFGMQNPGE